MLKELVEKSRSYRSFKPNTNIEESVLLELVDIARKCPAAMNTQPLKYRLIKYQISSATAEGTIVPRRELRAPMLALHW